MQKNPPLDQLGRPLGVLRLSLTARCNLACTYCLPDGKEPEGLLTMANRIRLITAAVKLGVHSLKLTGGEPLLNLELEALIAAVQPLRQKGLREITLTTNGLLLTADRAKCLKKAGLDRISISLDGTTGAAVSKMAGLKDETIGKQTLAKVLAAIDNAQASGFDPSTGALKINAVIKRHANHDQLLPLAKLARSLGIELRLIEFMDVGNRNQWNSAAVVTAAEMVAEIKCEWPLEAIGRNRHNTASKWRYLDGGGSIAIVASISAPFCGDCNRLRITADGIAYTCLFAMQNDGLDLKPMLNNSCELEEIENTLSAFWLNRKDRYSEERFTQSSLENQRAEMAYLGG